METKIESVSAIILVFAIGMALASCKENPVDPSGGQSDEIRYATYKYQFDWFGHDTTLFKAFYISMAMSDSNHYFYADSDPLEPLVKEFDKHVPPVKRFTEGHYVGQGFYDNISGRRGVIFRVAQITMTSSTTAQLDGGEYFGGLGADTFLFYVSKKGGIWSVDSTHWWHSS